MIFWLPIHVVYWCHKAALWWGPWWPLMFWAPCLTKLLSGLLSPDSVSWFPYFWPVAQGYSVVFVSETSLSFKNTWGWEIYGRVRLRPWGRTGKRKDHQSALLSYCSWIVQKCLLSSFLCEVLLLQSAQEPEPRSYLPSLCLSIIVTSQGKVKLVSAVTHPTVQLT